MDDTEFWIEKQSKSNDPIGWYVSCNDYILVPYIAVPVAVPVQLYSYTVQVQLYTIAIHYTVQLYSYTVQVQLYSYIAKVDGYRWISLDIAGAGLDIADA